jgi:NAD(P)-dependent dehydrogenase (short-subunit alcohol dehydrogenase family)
MGKNPGGAMKIEKGNKVLITGAASGIGRSTAIAMSALGGRLFLTDINGKKLEEVAGMISKNGGEVCRSKALDVSRYEEVRAFADEIHKDFGPMDIVMNIAGIALFALVEDMTHSHWKKVIDINLWGPIHIIECFVPQMISAKKGHIVNVASLAGIAGLPWHGAYSTSKAGLVRLSEVLRLDLRQHNISVTLVCPGGVDTPLKNTVEILGVDNNGKFVQVMKQRFTKHAISPDKVAEQIVDAIERNKFMVITSFDVKFIYFCKHHLSPVYNYVLTYVSRLMNSGRYPKAKN